MRSALTGQIALAGRYHHRMALPIYAFRRSQSSFGGLLVALDSAMEATVSPRASRKTLRSECYNEKGRDGTVTGLGLFRSPIFDYSTLLKE
jgi:hypothetical protein